MSKLQHTENAPVASRLWGEWEPRFFGSGTTIVHLREYQHKPWLYIYADVAVDDSRYARDRCNMCYQLADFLNGGPPPLWLSDFTRRTETYADALAGANISAVGPMIDRNPPALDWVHDDSSQCVDDRARLMDALFNREGAQ
jgi:hypothetical protein